MSISNSALGKPTDPPYMSIADFGELSITLSATMKDKVFSLDIGAKNRMEALSMETQPGETVDQFIGRLRGCLRALWQGQRVQGTKEQKLQQQVAGKVMQQIGEQKK